MHLLREDIFKNDAGGVRRGDKTTGKRHRPNQEGKGDLAFICLSLSFTSMSSRVTASREFFASAAAFTLFTMYLVIDSPSDDSLLCVSW